MAKIKSNMLKGKRALKGLTQKNVSEMIGVSEKTYNHKEAGKIKFKVDEIIIISSVFNLNMNEINYIFLIISYQMYKRKTFYLIISLKEGEINRQQFTKDK